MAKLKHKAVDVIKAIKGSGGVKSTIAKKLNVSRITVDNYLERWESVKQAFDEECQLITDVAKHNLIKDIIDNKSIDTSKWWLRMKSDEFAPTDKVQHSGTIKQINVVKENR